MLSIIGGLTVLVILAVIILVLVKKNKGGGLFGRAANLAEGKADRAMEEMEQSDPEAVFRAAILETEKDVAKLNELNKKVKGLEFAARQKATDTESEIDEVEEMIKVAVDQEDEEMGNTLCSKQEGLEELKADYLETANMYETQAKDTQELLNNKKTELEELRVEMKQADNILQSAEIISKIRDRQNGVANDAVAKGLNSAREKLAASKAELAADKDIEGNSMEAKMRELKKKGAASSGKEKFAARMAAKNKKE